MCVHAAAAAAKPRLSRIDKLRNAQAGRRKFRSRQSQSAHNITTHNDCNVINNQATRCRRLRVKCLRRWHANRLSRAKLTTRINVNGWKSRDAIRCGIMRHAGMFTLA